MRAASTEGDTSDLARPDRTQGETDRFYTKRNLGPDCAARCGLRVPLALSNAGVRVHPTCSGARW